MADRNLNESRIIALLKELDERMEEQCLIVICGGAAAIVGYGMSRLTGDIDILEPHPRLNSFYKAVKEISTSHGLDSKWINDGVKGFLDDLDPSYRERLIPLNANFRNLDVLIISKPDLITMKICAWRETDREDIQALGISQDDLVIINKNLTYAAKHSPDRAHKAQLVLSELGVQEMSVLKSENVGSLTELIQFHRQHGQKDATIEEIRIWRDAIDRGTKPAALALSILRDDPTTAKAEEIGMEL